MRPHWKKEKKNCGCPRWIVDKVREIREQATCRPIPIPGQDDKNGLQATTGRGNEVQSDI